MVIHLICGQDYLKVRFVSNYRFYGILVVFNSCTFLVTPRENRYLNKRSWNGDMTVSKISMCHGPRVLPVLPFSGHKFT